MDIETIAARADAGVECLGEEVGVAFQVQRDAAAQTDVEADAGTDAPESLDRLPKVAETFRGSQVSGLLVLQTEGYATADEAVNRERTVRPVSEECGTPVENEVQVGLDELETVDGTGFRRIMFRLPTVHGQPGAPEIIEAVADGDLSGRGEEFGKIRLAEIIGGATLELDERIRCEILGSRRKGERGQKGQN